MKQDNPIWKRIHQTIRDLDGLLPYQFVISVEGEIIEEEPRGGREIVVNPINCPETCSICLLPDVNCKTDCNHLFHRNCLQQWAEVNNVCPYCRSMIKVEQNVLAQFLTRMSP